MIATLLLVGGCGSRTVLQCNQLADVVNQTDPALAEFETTLAASQSQSSQVDDLADIQAIATDYTQLVNQVVGYIDTLTADLAAVPLKDEQLSQLRDRYATVMTAYGSALNDASSAMAAVAAVESEQGLARQIRDSQDQLMTAVTELRSLTEQQNALVQDFNTYCGATPSPTAAVSDQARGDRPQ